MTDSLPAPIEPAVQEAIDYLQETTELKKNLEVAFIDLGRHLKRIKDEKLYLHGYENFLGFLDDIKVSESVASRLIAIYDKFIIQLGYAPAQVAEAGGWSLVSTILPVIQTREDADEWMNKATTLTRADLRREIKEHQSGIDMTKCEHAETYTVTICRDCGDRWQAK